MKESHSVGHGKTLDESNLVQRLAMFLKKQNYRVRLEISNMGQSADVIATRGRWVMAIEAKIKDWPRALRQCQAHEQIADYICVAVALASIPQNLENNARALGYGILHYSKMRNSFQWVLMPQLNRNVWAPQRRKWSRGLKGVPYVN